MAKNETQPIEALTYEQALAELETIVAALESPENTLETAMLKFERGQALLKHCTRLLEQADLKVQALLGETLGEFEADQ